MGIENPTLTQQLGYLESHFRVYFLNFPLNPACKFILLSYNDFDAIGKNNPIP